MTKQVGVIGLGQMGLPISKLLLNKGFRVAAHDPREEAMRAAEDLGAVPCPNPREVAQRSELTIILVGFDSQVNQVVLGEDGLLAGAKPGATIAIASTVDPATSRELGRIGAERGVEFLDIPLCRGEKAAAEGTLLIMGGGEESRFNDCRAVFEVFASDIHYLGPIGAGQVGKMINNLLLWACISVNHEGLKLGELLGVDPETLRQALLQSSGNNWALETWQNPRTMPWAEKDMAIVMKSADDTRISLPLCGVVREVIKQIKIERGLPVPKVT